MKIAKEEHGKSHFPFFFFFTEKQFENLFMSSINPTLLFTFVEYLEKKSRSSFPMSDPLLWLQPRVLKDDRSVLLSLSILSSGIMIQVVRQPSERVKMLLVSLLNDRPSIQDDVAYTNLLD